MCRKTSTNRGELFVESIHEATEYIARVADLLSILSNDPDECSPCIGLIQLINALAQGRDNTLVSGVLSENVFDDHYRFLDDVIHLRVDQVQ